MKEQLKRFNVEKTLRQLCESTIDLLLTSQAEVPETDIITLRQTKSKKELLKYQIETVANSLNCYRILRTAYFFHQHPDKVPSLCAYLISKGLTLAETNPKSHADHVCLLYLAHPEHVADYFTISFHTCQSKRYMQRRTDYIDPATKPETARQKISEIADHLLDDLKAERSTARRQLRQFEHEDKLFAIIEFDDTPTVTREFEKEQPQDQFRRFALDLTFVFDLKSGAVDVIADSAELREKMHRASAAIIYNKDTIPARPPKNEVFDLQKLMGMIESSTPLAISTSQSAVTTIYVNEITIRQTGHPNMKATLNAGITAKTISHRTDWVKNARDMLTSIVNTKDESSSWWHKSRVELTHAQLIALFWDEIEKNDMSKSFTIKSTGDTSLGHDTDDEEVKKILRELGLLKERPQDKTQTETRHETEQLTPTILPAESI